MLAFVFSTALLVRTKDNFYHVSKQQSRHSESQAKNLISPVSEGLLTERSLHAAYQARALIKSLPQWKTCRSQFLHGQETMQAQKKRLTIPVNLSGWGQRSRTSTYRFRVCCPAIRRAPTIESLFYQQFSRFTRAKPDLTRPLLRAHAHALHQPNTHQQGH